MPWFNVYPEYYAGELKKHIEFKPQVDAIEKHNELKLSPENGIVDWEVATEGPVPVYTDYEDIKKLLTD